MMKFIVIDVEKNWNCIKYKYNYGNHEGMKPKLVKLLIALTEMKRNSYEFSIDFLLELVYSIKKNNNKL